MALVIPPFDKKLQNAIAHYWNTLNSQAEKQVLSDADRGGRAAVTGGKQMDGFCELVNWLLLENGVDKAHIYVRNRLDLPGYFRPTKCWDMLVVMEKHLVAAIEFKSQRGSFGNNFNNRTEEALGSAADLWTAYREGAFGLKTPRPWLGWVMLLEDNAKSNAPVKVDESHFCVFPEFKDASYSKRYEILLKKLKLEKLYDGAAFITSSEHDGKDGLYKEPSEDLSMKQFLIGLISHISAFQTSING